MTHDLDHDDDHDDDQDLDVVVVGCGPVGVTLAALLARRGLRVLAVDREVSIHPLPRAVHFDQEVMRVFQELGCADELSRSTVANPGMDFITADRKVLLSMRPGADTPSGWPASNFFHQPDLELLLRRTATGAGARLRLGVGVEAVDDHGHCVTVRLSDGSSVRTAYAVGCDGARSTVRKQLGIEMHDLQFEEPWLVVDLVLGDGTPPPTDVTLQVCDPRRPTTLVPMPPPRFRFEFMLVDGDDEATVQAPASVRSMLAAWVDPGTVTVERSAVYTFHGLVARQWRQGRVMLAGDAAHQTPPFLGQGMCAGIRDAANLAWKLAMVIDGRATPALLDTYQLEREPHVRHLVESAVSFGRLICTTDPAVAAARDADLLAARAAGGGHIGGAPMPALGEGPLIRTGGGQQACQPLVDGRRLDDVVGDRFAVVTRSADPPCTATRWWAERGAVVLSAEETPAVAAVLDALRADAVVIRPDRYLLSAGAEPLLPDRAGDLLAVV